MLRFVAVPFLQRAATPDQITQGIVCRSQDGPEDSTDTLRPDIQEKKIIDLCNFFKSQSNHKQQEGGFKEIQL